MIDRQGLALQNRIVDRLLFAETWIVWDENFG